MCTCTYNTQNIMHKTTNKNIERIKVYWNLYLVNSYSNINERTQSIIKHVLHLSKPLNLIIYLSYLTYTFFRTKLSHRSINNYIKYSIFNQWLSTILNKEKQTKHVKHALYCTSHIDILYTLDDVWINTPYKKSIITKTKNVLKPNKLG